MPTLAIFKGEPLDKLVTRLFPTTTAGGAQASRQAADALLKANPQLSDPGRLSPGTVIVVPDLPQQAANSRETLQTATLAPADAARLLGEHAAAFATALAAQVTGTTAQANATLTLLKDPGLTSAAARDRTLAARLTALTNSTNAALADIPTQQAVIAQGLAQLQQDLAKFTASTLPGTPSPVTPSPVTPSPPVTPTPGPRPAVTSSTADEPPPARAPRAARKKKT
jgi:phage tail protein X